MAYKFGAGEPVHDAIARCAKEQLDHAIEELTEGVNDDPVRAIHGARKAIKKERSLLRLARGAMPAKQRRQENEALRDAARRLAGARDAEVLGATVGGLAEHFVGQLPATTFDAIRDELKTRHTSGHGIANGSDPHREATDQLREVRGRITGWELDADDWPAIEKGLIRSYKRGRKAFAAARASEAAQDLHDWRKRVKDLWYHQRLLAPVCGPIVGGQAKDAHRLADLLGDGHDLDLLREELTREAVPVAVDVDAVLKLLDLRNSELREQALRLGDRVYSEPPKAFRRRIKRLWTAGRAVAVVPQQRQPAEVAAATRAP